MQELGLCSQALEPMHTHNAVENMRKFNSDHNGNFVRYFEYPICRMKCRWINSVSLLLVLKASRLVGLGSDPRERMLRLQARSNHVTERLDQLKLPLVTDNFWQDLHLFQSVLWPVMKISPVTRKNSQLCYAKNNGWIDVLKWLNQVACESDTTILAKFACHYPLILLTASAAHHN